MLMDPAFPDIVGEWAEETARADAKPTSGANDNESNKDELSDPFLPLLLEAEIEANRIW
jgi:hypothetical protein